jgi:hypothetical protein
MTRIPGMIAAEAARSRGTRRRRVLLRLAAGAAALTVAAVLALPAVAQERHEWHGGPSRSWVELHAPTAPGAAASVTFHDEPVHTGGETFSLTLDGLTLSIRVEHMGAMPGERLHLTAPAGYYVWPEVLQPGEHKRGTAHIYPLGVTS